MDTKAIGKQINHRRKLLGLNLRDLAELTGLSKRTISQIERGEGNPTLAVLLRLFEYLNLEFKVELKKQGPKS